MILMTVNSFFLFENEEWGQSNKAGTERDLVAIQRAVLGKEVQCMINLQTHLSGNP